MGPCNGNTNLPQNYTLIHSISMTNKLLLFLSLLLTCVGNVMAGTFVGGRTDFRDETIYFAMTTRFYDGDPSNNVCCWDNQAVQISTKDPCWRGDFKGLIEKLDYIKALGFTAVWITPIVQNGSGYDYHGYHAMDHSSVDIRYKSEDVDFKDLIEAAHAKEMKIVLDVVLQHTGNFGEANLCKLFDRDQKICNQANIETSLKANYEVLGSDYDQVEGSTQYARRLAMMKNTDGVNHDTKNYWHHYGNFNWDEPNRWWAQIAGDCVDLNTENPAVSDYIVKCYKTFIDLGVDGFRIDTSGHIARLTFNNNFIPQFTEAGAAAAGKRLNNCPFFMFGEVCARYNGSTTYRGQPALSPYFYTWKSDDDLNAEYKTYTADWWASQTIMEGDGACVGNMLTCEKEATRYSSTSNIPQSTNAKMVNGRYHTPDYSQASGFSVIDFPMHYDFNSAASAYSYGREDANYNDATYNVVYVDSHDYGPGPNDATRFSGGTEQWAENLSLMFTFRGIPCIYYGSEVEFMKGAKIDNGPNGPLNQTGRAYFGQYLEGTVTATDFGQYTASGNVSQTLQYDLAQHIIRLNQIRAAVPALRKGQWTSDDCSSTSGGIAFKRAYEDSYALVALNGGATFGNCPAGTYVDLVTGDSQTCTEGGTITVSAPSNKGQIRVYVKGWTGGKVGKDGKFIYEASATSTGVTPSFSDPGADFFYTADDAIGSAAVKFSPAGGSFKTETQEVTMSLNAAAVSGWYKIGASGVQETLTGDKTITIGEDMAYDDKLTIYWGATDSEGAEETGSVTFRKVDPNSVITVYVKASSAPYIYLWDNEKNELAGAWPGTGMSETTTVGGEEYYIWTVADADVFNMVLNNGSGQQTGNITGISDDIYVEYNGTTGYTDITSSVDTDPTNIKVKADKKAGTYYAPFTLTLTTSVSGGLIAYSTDGSELSASSTQGTSPLSIEVSESMTVKAAALVNGELKNAISLKYVISNEPAPAVKVYYDNANGWSQVYIYAYVNEEASKNAAWPGKAMTWEPDTEIDGVKGWWVYTVESELEMGRVIVNNNSGAQYPASGQPGLELNGTSKVLRGTVISEAPTEGSGEEIGGGEETQAIGQTQSDKAQALRIYSIDGRQVNRLGQLGRGIYIVNGRKVLVK